MPFIARNSGNAPEEDNTVSVTYTTILPEGGHTGITLWGTDIDGKKFFVTVSNEDAEKMMSEMKGWMQ